MSLFSFFTGNPAHKIASRSNKVVGIFTKTKTKLLKLNQDAQEESKLIEARMIALQQEQSTIDATIATNAAVIANIDKIFQ